MSPTRPRPTTAADVVVGGDGAGKSTPAGHSWRSSAPQRHHQVSPKEEIGYVPATAGLYVDLTVDENLASPAVP